MFELGFIIALVVATMTAATPLILAAVGELVSERSGVLNLGVEGMMLIGASVGFAVAAETASPLLAVIAGSAASMVLALVFAFLTLSCMANQVATGLALTIFGAGASAYIGAGYTGSSLGVIEPFALPYLSQIPVLGPLIFSLEPLTYFAFAMCGLVWWFLIKSRAGLALRAVGDAPEAAHANGFSVLGIRYLAVLFGGAMAGVGGAFLSVFYTPVWVENMTAGRGWIAVALVVFAAWNPTRLLLGAFLFGGVTILQFHIQSANFGIPTQFLSMLPYAATIVVLVVISSDRLKIMLNTPASLGVPFRR
jgi:simple sugar transport system permease protein